MILKFMDCDGRWIVVGGASEIEVSTNWAFALRKSTDPDCPTEYVFAWVKPNGNLDITRQLVPARNRTYVDYDALIPALKPQGYAPVKVIAAKLPELGDFEYMVVPESSEIYLMNDSGETIDKF